MKVPASGVRLLWETIQFTKLCGVMFVLVVIAAGCEAGVLWLAGYRYIPKQGLADTPIANVALSAQGRWGACRVGFRSQALRGDITYDVVLVDLERSDARSLQIEELQPEVVAVCPQSDRLAIGCRTGAIYSCGPPGEELSSNGPLQPMLFTQLSNGPIWNLVFSSGGKYLAAADRLHTYVWCWETGALIRQEKYATSNPCLAFSQDETQFVSQSGDELAVWELTSGQRIRSLTIKEGITVAAVSPSLNRVAVIASDRTLRMYDFITGAEQWRTSWTRSEGQSLEFTRDGAELCVGGVLGRIACFETRLGQQRAPLQRKSVMLGYTFGADGLLYSWCRGGDICVWNIDHRRPVSSFSLLDWAREKHKFQAAIPAGQTSTRSTL